MADEQEDLAPHSIILDIRWESHRQMSDGRFVGGASDKGRAVFDIKGENRALAIEYLNVILEKIKGSSKNVAELKNEAERLRESRVSGVSESRGTSPIVFGMRGRVGSNRVGGPDLKGNV